MLSLTCNITKKDVNFNSMKTSKNKFLIIVPIVTVMVWQISFPQHAISAKESANNNGETCSDCKGNFCNINKHQHLTTKHDKLKEEFIKLARQLEMMEENLENLKEIKEQKATMPPIKEINSKNLEKINSLLEKLNASKQENTKLISVIDILKAEIEKSNSVKRQLANKKNEVSALVQELKIANAEKDSELKKMAITVENLKDEIAKIKEGKAKEEKKKRELAKAKEKIKKTKKEKVEDSSKNVKVEPLTKNEKVEDSSKNVKVEPLTKNENLASDFAEMLKRISSQDKAKIRQAIAELEKSKKYKRIMLVPFRRGFSIMSNQVKSELESKIKSLGNKGKVILAGFADPGGSDYINNMISRQRADSVAKVLVENKITSKRISKFYLGETTRFGNTKDTLGRNRCVEIWLLKN